MLEKPKICSKVLAYGPKTLGHPPQYLGSKWVPATGSNGPLPIWVEAFQSFDPFFYMGRPLGDAFLAPLPEAPSNFLAPLSAEPLNCGL